MNTKRKTGNRLMRVVVARAVEGARARRQRTGVGQVTRRELLEPGAMNPKTKSIGRRQAMMLSVIGWDGGGACRIMRREVLVVGEDTRRVYVTTHLSRNRRDVDDCSR